MTRIVEGDLYDVEGLGGLPLQARIAVRGRGLTRDAALDMIKVQGQSADDDVASAYDVILGRDS